MSSKFFVTTLIMAVILIAAILGFYLHSFGFHRSTDQAVWGAFGDYFAGILNPVFALFAFIAVLYSLNLQIKQIGQIAVDKRAQEILEVIKDIDTRINQIMTSGNSEFDIVKIAQEAERKVSDLGRPDDFSRFLRRAKESGSEVESTINNLMILLISMHDFLQRHPKGDNGSITPIIEYYISKTSRLIPLMEMTATLPRQASDFFKQKNPLDQTPSLTDPQLKTD